MNIANLPTTATPYGRLLYAIAYEREAWAVRQAPAGQEMNDDRDQEEADSVVETLDGIIRAAHGDMRSNAPTTVLPLGPDAALMVRDALDILQPDCCHADAIRRQMLHQLSRFCDGLSASEATGTPAPADIDGGVNDALAPPTLAEQILGILNVGTGDPDRDRALAPAKLEDIRRLVEAKA